MYFFRLVWNTGQLDIFFKMFFSQLQESYLYLSWLFFHIFFLTIEIVQQKLCGVQARCVCKSKWKFPFLWPYYVVKCFFYLYSTLGFLLDWLDHGQGIILYCLCAYNPLFHSRAVVVKNSVSLHVWAFVSSKQGIILYFTLLQCTAVSVVKNSNPLHVWAFISSNKVQYYCILPY